MNIEVCIFISTLHGSEGGDGDGQVEGGGGAEQAGAAQLQTRGLVLWNTGEVSLEADRQLSTILGTSSTSGGGLVWSGLVTTTQVNTEISPPPSFSPKLMYEPHLADLYWSKHMGDSYRCKTI